jgi:hypothetical protein
MHDYPDFLAVAIACRSMLSNCVKQLGISCQITKQGNTQRNTANPALIKKRGEESVSL